MYILYVYCNVSGHLALLLLIIIVITLGIIRSRFYFCGPNTILVA